jgi:uncharacterized membrane protein YhaH (DUF805 family)
MIVFFFALLTIKLFHILFLWVSFFVNEKIALDDFITKMYIENDVDGNTADRGGDGPSSAVPPPLWRIPLRVFISDVLAIAVIMTAVTLFARRFIDQPVVGGQKLLMLLFADILIAYVLAFAVSVLLAFISQSQSCCRYKDDGIRGIRAYSFTALAVSMIICLPPYFLIV